MKRHNQKGFTLAELLVVISILGLLASIVLVSISGATEKARIAKILQWSQSLHSLLGADVVGLWRMDENPASHGTIIEDISGKGNNGTLFTNDGSTNKAVAGVVGGALSFDGVNDYVNCGSGASLNITNAITVEAWVKFPVVDGGAHDVVSKRQSSLGWALVRYENYYRFYAHETVWKKVQSDTIAAANVWTHFVGTWQTNEPLRLYINGVKQVQETAFTGPLGGADYNLQISGYLVSYEPWDGLIDEVRIYNRALETAQIEASYYAGLDRLLAKGLIDKQEYKERLVMK